MSRLDEEEIDLVTSTTQQVWLRRNQWVFDKKLSAPIHVVQCALEQLEAAKTCNSGTRSNCQQCALHAPRVPEKWKVPPLDFLKCNWDAALDLNRQRMGMGILIHNHERVVILAKCSTQMFITDPLIAETVAV
jgi:hypothetical protein